MKKIFTLLTATLLVTNIFAVCSGSSNVGNPELCGAATCNQWVNGYDWSISTDGSGNVLVTFTIKDDLGEGLVPEIYCKKGDNVTWTNATVSGNDITVSLTGYSKNDGLTIALKVASSKGVTFSDYIGYIVGDDCQSIAGCTGEYKDIDFEYTDSKEWTNGYTYSFETTADGVKVTFELLDKFEGMANPVLFDKTDPTTLVEKNMTLAGYKAYTTLTGYSEGDIINVLMKMPIAGGQLFTRRIGYVVGSDCSEWDDACGESSTASDEEYYKGDPSSKPWTNGYDYRFTTTENGNVLIKFDLKDKFTGMSNPNLFIFDTTTPGHPLKGNPIDIDMYGIGAYYEMSGVTVGEEIEVMLKMAVSGGVLWSERLTYTVGQECGTAVAEVSDDKVSLFPNPVEDVLNINPSADTDIFSMDGKLLFSGKECDSINISNLSAGLYIAKLHLSNGEAVTKQLIKK